MLATAFRPRELSVSKAAIHVFCSIGDFGLEPDILCIPSQWQLSCIGAPVAEHLDEQFTQPEIASHNTQTATFSVRFVTEFQLKVVAFQKERVHEQTFVAFSGKQKVKNESSQSHSLFDRIQTNVRNAVSTVRRGQRWSCYSD